MSLRVRACVCVSLHMCVCVCVCETHVHAGVCAVFAVCLFAAGGVGVDLISVPSLRSSSCSRVCGEVLVHVVYMTLCLCGFIAVVSIPALVSASSSSSSSSFSSRRNFSRD